MRGAENAGVYTHARQFPHLAGKSDAEIRLLVHKGMLNRPGLARTMRIRNLAVLCSMLIAGIFLGRLTSLGAGAIMMVVGGVATAFALCWNLVWVNTVVYKLSQQEICDEHPNAHD